jgi:hypothetical protein
MKPSNRSNSASRPPGQPFRGAATPHVVPFRPLPSPRPGAGGGPVTLFVRALYGFIDGETDLAVEAIGELGQLGINVQFNRSWCRHPDVMTGDVFCDPDAEAPF